MLYSILDKPGISKWTLSSTFFHLVALGVIFFWNVQQQTPRPKKLIVQTVRIHELQQPKPQPIVDVSQTIIEPQIEPPPEAIALEEPIIEEPIIEKPLVAEAPEPPIPDSLPAVPSEPEPAPTPPVPQQKKAVEKIEKAPTPQPKPKQPVKKKVEPAKKPAETKKIDSPKKKEPAVQPKQTQNQAQNQQKAREIAQKKAQEKAQETAKEKARQQALLEAKQKNIQAALNSLDQASSKSKSIVAVASEPVSSVKQVGTLHSENIQSITSAGEEEYAPKEARYLAELIHRLKLGLKLPEHGEVRVRLTLSRSGAVKQLSILKSSSSLNKNSIEQKLKGLTLPAFGMSFPGEEQHTFVLILTNAS